MVPFESTAKRFQLNITDSALLHGNYVQTSNKQTKICDIRAFPLHSTADRKPDLTRKMFPTTEAIGFSALIKR